MRALRYLLIFIVILVAAVVAIPFVIPADIVASQVVQLTKDKTGRDLTLGGDISFSVYPNVGVSLEDVSLSNPPGMPEGVMLTTGKMRLSLQLMPLLSGNVKVKTFELVEPRVNLLTDVNGKSNWDFGAPDAGRDQPSDPAPDATPDGGAGADFGQISLDDVRIVNGVVRYLDETAGTAFEGTNVNVALSLPSAQSNLNVSGSMTWRGETVELKTVLGPLDQLTQNKATNLQLQIASTHLATSFSGSLSLQDGFALDGKLDAKSPSLRNLAAWTGNPLAPGQGLEDFSAGATVKIAGGEISLGDAQLGLDGMRAQGTMTVNTNGTRPLITASLGVDQIDLNKYMTAPSNNQPSQPSAAAGWSDEPLDLSGLRAVDANLRMAASKIQYRKVTIDNSQLSVTMKGGQLEASLEKLSLYDGSAIGVLVLDGSTNTPTIAANFKTQGLSALPLLRDFAEFDWIEGTGQFAGNLTATGGSQRQLVQNLNGTLQVLFEDGAIRGINIAQMMRGLGTNILNGWSRSETQKTDFASLSASYKVTKGVAVNSDLSMLGPLVRLSGGGVVNMPNQTLDYRVDPKLVASLEGQGGAADLAGFNVPIIIKGPWAKPKIYPDIAGILDNPAEALKKLKAIGDIDPGKLGLNADQILSGGGDVIENVGDNLQDTLKDTLNPDDGGGGLLDNVLQGLGNDN